MRDHFRGFKEPSATIVANDDVPMLHHRVAQVLANFVEIGVRFTRKRSERICAAALVFSTSSASPNRAMSVAASASSDVSTAAVSARSVDHAGRKFGQVAHNSQ